MRFIFSYMFLLNFGFRLSEKLFLLFWQTTLLGIVFLVGKLFSFSTLNLLCHSWTSELLLKTHLSYGVPWYITCSFSLAVLKILFLSLTFDSLIIMCLSVDLFRFIFLEILGFLNLDISFLHQSREVFSHHFFKSFFFFFLCLFSSWDTYNRNICLFVVVF